MSITIPQLLSRLPNCRIVDQFSLRRMIEKAQSSKESLKGLIQAEEAIEASCRLVEEKRALKTEILYPDLPICARREEIAEAIQNNQVVILAGETGSGKTTQLPKICLDLGYGCKGLIGHTQPRRLAASTVANRIADELGTEIGQRVGYQVRFHDHVSENTQIKLMTDGILLAETINDRLFEKYEVIIIDEAHERSLNIDFLLGYIKRILPQRPDLKLIITSATIDLERFSKHFNNAPIFEVSGRTYPVDILYRPLMSDSEDDAEDKTQLQGIHDAVLSIIEMDKAEKRTGSRDVLVFLSGEREIRETAEMLRKAQLRDTEVMPLYARLSVSEQSKIFQTSRQAGRRIVLATNVAETSVTVPGIRYVIDTGVARISRYSYRSKVQRLPIEPISQASANQRAGRCGRVAEGVCIRLYGKDDFNQRPAFTDAEIRRTNLAAVILQMLNLRLGEISAFPFIDPPDSRFINDGFKLLEELGAVTQKRKLTAIGKKLSQLPVDPRIGRMLLEGYKQGALKEVLVIASALSVQDPRERPLDKQQAADQKHQQYADENSDFVALLNLWMSYEEQRQALSQNQLRKYCQSEFLSYLRMREWRDVHRQLHISCKQLGMKENAEPAGYKELHLSLLAGLLSHMGFKQENKEFLGARNRKFHIFPSSALFKKPPKWIIAAELVETTKLYARMIAKVEPEWAESLASHLVKRTHLEPTWHKKRGQVVAIEQVTLFGLLIVPKRLVNYGAIDKEVSHEIFIRSALVEGDFDTKGAFFKHNQQLLDHVEGLEAKARRKDLLVDEETLYDFYYQKLSALGGGDIVNAAGFEQWRKQVEAQDEKALFLTKEDILQRSAAHVSKQSYPDELIFKGMKLKLSYHFEPGAVDDGVSVTVPLALLKQLPVQRLEWLVPGMLQEKCVALLRALPKSRRKHFVPVPDYAAALVNALEFGEGGLLSAVSHQLLRMTGIKVATEEFQLLALDDHHRINIKLQDGSGKIVAQGRDWANLSERYGVLADQAIAAAPDEQWGRKGIESWDFGELAEKVKIKQAGGLRIDAWPSLIDHNATVELAVSLSESEAYEQSIKGVTRLAMLTLGSFLRPIRDKIPKVNESVLFGRKIFTPKSLVDEILKQAVRYLMKLDESLPRTESEFIARVDSTKPQLPVVVNQIALHIFAIHQQYHKIMKQLNGKVSLESVVILNDIKSQVAALIHAEYISNISWYQLQQYPRYMQAIEIRLEKFAREIPRQRLLSEQLQQQWSQYQQYVSQQKKLGLWKRDWDSYRWLLEEYRVSLFAQQLGTSEPVSEKRMKQHLQTLIADKNQ